MRQINFINVLLRNHLINYPTPRSINYFWGFGSAAGLFLCVQIISGIFLSMHYSGEAVSSFSSVEYIMRVVNQGWVLCYRLTKSGSIILLRSRRFTKKSLGGGGRKNKGPDRWVLLSLVFAVLMLLKPKTSAYFIFKLAAFAYTLFLSDAFWCHVFVLVFAWIGWDLIADTIEAIKAKRIQTKKELFFARFLPLIVVVCIFVYFCTSLLMHYVVFFTGII